MALDCLVHCHELRIQANRSIDMNVLLAGCARPPFRRSSPTVDLTYELK